MTISIAYMGRCDFIHILAMRKLQYFCRMERSKIRPITLCNVFQCFKLSDEYIKLLTLYRCGSSDSVYCVKRCVERHFAAISDSQ